MIKDKAKKRRLTYVKLLKKFEEKTAQVLRIKKDLDEKRRNILPQLKDDITNERLLDDLWKIGKREIWVRNIIVVGLSDMRDMLSDVEAKKADLSKVEAAINSFMKKIVKVTVRLRKEKRFVKHPTPDNYKDFIEAYDDEYYVSRETITEISTIELNKIDAYARYLKYGIAGFGTIFYLTTNSGTGGWEGVSYLVVGIMSGIMTAFIVNDSEALELETPFREKYGF